LSGLGCGLSGSVGRFRLRRVILQLRLLSMDQIMPLKLPRYMFRRANGSFRYKRNVPKDLRTVIPKATVYRQLGNTFQDALWALPKVHAEIEALFDLERRTTDEQRARELVRERLGERHKSMFIEGAVDPEWPEFDDFQELAEDVAHAVPKGVTQQLRAASSEPAPMSLARVLEEYFAYKVEETDTSLRTRIDRIRKDLIFCLGKNRFEWTELKDLTRSDANSYRDLLLSRMSPNSVQRNLGVVKAAINHVLLEHDLDFRNVFQAIKIKGAGSSNTDRLPINDDQLATMVPAFASSDVAKALLLLLTDTGARLAEITGLEAKDVDLDKAILHIRPNDRRGLKTKTSTRSIPLSQRATECLRQHQVGLSDTDPIFSTYAQPRGNDKASAMLMKRFAQSSRTRKSPCTHCDTP
jgi:integrase